MKIHKNVEQGSKDWHDLRRCKITGTRLDAVMGTPLAQVGLIAELIAEEATEQAKAIKPTVEMERGTAEEIFAIKAFKDKTGKQIERVGICVHEDFDWLAYSPDGLIQDEEGVYSEDVEVKSPDSKTAILYRMANLQKIPSKKMFIGVPIEYKWQIVQAFIVNQDLKKRHFIVYDARFISDDTKLYVVEVSRDNPEMQEAITEAMEALEKFRVDWINWKEMVLPSKF